MIDVSSQLILHKENKQEIVKLCASIQDKKTLRETIYRISIPIVLGTVPPDLAVSTLYEIIKSNELAICILADIICILDIESQVLGENEPIYRENFIEFLKLSNNHIISDWLLKERLEYSTLADAKIIDNEKAASTKFIRLKTKLYYKQQKFNLFREESEGYSKLLTELCQDGQFEPEYMLNAIKSLIGCFNLDPNRVLDLILECFEARLHLKDSFLFLVKSFSNNPQTLNQILAFKFNFYNNSQNETLEAPSSLYDVAAVLIHHGLVDLENLYPYLYPSDSKICELHKNDIIEAKEFPKIMSEILSEGNKFDDVNVFEDVKIRKIGSNQKLGLILSLLKLGDWENGSKLMNKIPEYFALSYPDISDALSCLVDFLIGPLYKKCSTLPSVLSSRIVLPPENRYPMKPITDFNGFKSVLPMLFAFGPYLYRDPLLFSKLIRILRVALQTSIPSYEDLKYDTISLLNVTFLPSISLIECNSALAEELWYLLKLFPYHQRYLLYYFWKKEPTNPLSIKMKAFTMRRIKYIMKRLSKDKDVIKQSGRFIGKLSHSNPTFLFEYMLGQIQSYDNLIGPVVDSLRYLSSLSYDVLLFCVIEVLSNPAKEHSKHEGTSISPWLLSLGNFCGAVIKKYQIEPPGLLQFVANQLKVGKCLDLLLLKEIVQKMTGIESTVEMTDEQLEALSGGELLRTEGGSFNQIRNIKKSTLRLKDALLENNLAMPLCILMAQQRNGILFQSESNHLKLIGKLYDQCQETLVQYGNFLSNALTIDDYKRRLPSVTELLMDFHLSSDVTFFLIRPMISHDITSVYEELSKPEKAMTSVYECFNKATETVLNPIIADVSPALTNLFSIELNPRFFVIFWTLTMYDLQVPERSYQREKNKIMQQIQQLEDNKDLTFSKKRKETDRLRVLIEKLSNEQHRQTEQVSKTRSLLEHEKKTFFDSNVNKMDSSTNFLQHCLIPRCKFTALDALYCAEFVKLLHNLKTPNFSSLICFDRIFGDISYTMSSCTENEANHYGRFLSANLKVLAHWHKDIKAFEAECSKFPGFVTKFCEKDPVHIDYESFRHVCHKWHYRLTKAFIICLDSGEYIQIRNSLIVLTKLLPYFPVMTSFGQAIERRIEKVVNEEKEKRQDLHALATGYGGQLRLKKDSYIPENEFHNKDPKKPLQPPPQNVAEPKTEPVQEEPPKKEHRNNDNLEKIPSKPKPIKPPRSSEMEVDPKKVKEIRTSKRSEEKSPLITLVKDTPPPPTSHASSASSSPKRTDHRSIKEDNDDNRKRKNDPRVSEEPHSSRASSHERKSLRKRQAKEPSQELPDIKRKKDNEDSGKPLKRNDDRNGSGGETRKSSEPKRSSRRYKADPDK